MAEVNLSLRFQASNTSVINEVLEGLQKIESKTLKKFKIQLDSEEFVKNLNSLKSAIGRLGLDNGLVANINSVSKALNSINMGKLDTTKLKDFVDALKSINVNELKQVAGSLHSIGNALNNISGAKPPNINSFVNSINKLNSANFDATKIEKLLNAIKAFQGVNLEILGTKDLNQLFRILKNFSDSGLDDSVVKKLNNIAKALSRLKININMSGLEAIPEMIKRLRQIDKLQLDEQKFLKKMETIKKGFEQLSQAKIDINKIKSMADLMRELNGAGGGGGSGGSSGFGGMGGILGSILSISAVNTQIEAAKDLEYAILQVGVAGELSSNQMAEVKNEMFDFSRASGKSALEITQAMDAIIKTGQSLSDSSLILETSVKTAVAAGE
jgi:Asp-tRNA(Asn)/Glu-tRNA(Gln) amidotransferase C subunit